MLSTKNMDYNIINIIKCIKDIKIEITEGYDRIPLKVIVDGISQLIAPLSNLFEFIYKNKLIPEQWKCSKIKVVTNVP